MKSKNKNELSIKSKLLFNNLDMNFRTFLDLSAKEEKRKKALNNILSTYKLTIRPFIADESKEYQDKVYTAIENKYNNVCKMIDSKMTVETLSVHVKPILDDLKSMITTCKTNLTNVNTLWKI